MGESMENIVLIPREINLHMPIICWGANLLNSIVKNKFRDIINIVDWSSFSMYRPKIKYFKSCRVEIILISDEKKGDVQFFGKEILFKNNDNCFRNLDQIFLLIKNNLKFFYELIWMKNIFPIIPYLDEKDDLFVLYIIRGKRSRKLCFEKYECFKQRSFYFYSYGVDRSLDCPKKSDQYCLLVRK